MINLLFTRRARRDAEAARSWYEEKSPGLGDEFREELNAAVDRLRARPLLYQVVESDVRRTLVHRFPYSVLYLVESDRIVVVGVLRQSQDPALWSSLRPDGASEHD